jgi:hypothetical protein
MKRAPLGRFEPAHLAYAIVAAAMAFIGLTAIGCGSDSAGGGDGGNSAGGSTPSAGGSKQTGGASGSAGGGGTGRSTGSGGSGGTGSTGRGGSSATGSGGGTSSGSGGTSGGSSGGASGSGGTSSNGSGGSARDSGTAGSPGTGGGASEGGATGPVAGLPEYWIAPAPTGNDRNAGTQASPFFTVVAALQYARAGSTIWVEPGTYRYANIINLTMSGTQAAPFNIKAVAGGTRPIFDFSLQPRNSGTFRGIDIPGDFWHITGIEIENAADNCINIGGSNNTIENVIVHQCGDTGIQITVDGSLAGNASKGANNTILNCDSWGNLDVATGGENADGFAAKLAIGAGNVFRGCRSWNNADDGWDFFAANDVVTIDSCWSFSNGKTLQGGNNPQGDGNGFKLGGRQSGTDLGGAVHIVRNSFAFENLACGFTRNNNPNVPSLSSSGSARNGGSAYCPGTSDFTMTGANNGFTMTAAQAMAAQRNADGSLPAIH